MNLPLALAELVVHEDRSAALVGAEAIIPMTFGRTVRGDRMFDTHQRGGRRRVAVWATVILLVAVAGLLLVRITLGRYVLEKLLTQLAMPCGLIWLGLAGGCVMLRGQKAARSLLIALLRPSAAGIRPKKSSS